MALLVEGVQNVSRALAGNVGASRPTASLPPSSVAQASEKASQAVQEEGASTARGGDLVSLSGSSRALNGQAPRESGTADTASGAGSDPANVNQSVEESLQKEEERLSQIAEAFNQQQDQLQVRIRYDDETGLRLFQFVEKNSGEVVRQLPPDDVVAFTKRFQSISGLLFSEQA
jgi:flagellar protein FlaG